MIIGTNYFATRPAAFQYYGRQGVGALDVLTKMKTGEVKVGNPPKQAGETSRWMDQDGRWHISFID